MSIRRIAKGIRVLAATPSKQLFTETRYKKFSSELERLLYYWIEGYSAGHPWGLFARPPIPENVPLTLKDSKTGKDTREVIVKKLKSSQWDSNFRKFLRELAKEIKDNEDD